MTTNAEALTRALEYHRGGKLPEAEELYRGILQTEPHHVDALQLLGAVAAQTGRDELAVTYLQEALRQNPDFAEVHNNLGTIQTHQGKLDDAVGCFRQAIRLKPGYAEAHYNLGFTLQKLDRQGEAAECYREAIRLKPNYPEAHLNLSNALRDLDQQQEAAETCWEAIRLRPDYAEAHYNLGIALENLGKQEEAAAYYREAIRHKPDYAEAHANLGQVYLQAGDLEQGWREYEWRWRCKDFPQPFLPTSRPAWDGSPLNGRTIFLYAEQGLGDAVQFIRYAPLVKAQGGRVIVGCRPPLLRLLQGCAGVDQVVVNGSQLPPFDAFAPLMSLPRLLGTASLDQIPSGSPYLKASPDLIEGWRVRLASVPGLRVGIVWQGSPTNVGDRRRSVRFEEFAPLANLGGVSLISLQKGSGREQLRQHPGVIDLGTELTDLAETAALLENLDLVVTVDTAVAHLAGALGIPVWVVLPFAPSWRWLLGREDSPWYPSMRLFRQTRPAGWGDVFAKITTALDGRLRSEQGGRQ